MALNRSRAVVLVAAVLGVALTARLGLWQLDRAAQKTERATRIAERDLAPVLPIDALPGVGRSDAALEYRRAVLQGRWLPAHTVFLENRQLAGQPGFLVLTPLRLADGSAVLVQRGWTPRQFLDRSAVPDVPTPAQTVQLDVRIAPGPAKLMDFGEAGRGRIRQNLDLNDFAREIGVPLRGWSAWQLRPAQRLDGPMMGAPTAASTPPSVAEPAAETVPDGLRREWAVPVADVSKHHGYAFQWFALSALIFGLYVWFQHLRPPRPAAAAPS